MTALWAAQRVSIFTGSRSLCIKYSAKAGSRIVHWTGSLKRLSLSRHLKRPFPRRVIWYKGTWRSGPIRGCPWFWMSLPEEYGWIAGRCGQSWHRCCVGQKNACSLYRAGSGPSKCQLIRASIRAALSLCFVWGAVWIVVSHVLIYPRKGQRLYWNHLWKWLCL